MSRNVFEGFVKSSWHVIDLWADFSLYEIITLGLGKLKVK